jgi:saccharopine dehydrogenase-like NADP-dependent oxidoreductase
MRLEGTNNFDTAMSKTVGLPIALLIEIIITNNLKFKGVLLPFDKIIYDPLLEKLSDNGIIFENRVSKT